MFISITALLLHSAGVLGLFGFVDDLLILLIVFLHLAAVYRSLLLYRHGGQ
jgi:RING finger protein 170